MFYAFLSVILVIVGVVNLLSEPSGIIGWALLVTGLVILIKKLSRPKKSYGGGKTKDGGASFMFVGSDSSSDSSGGDCGGGGE